MAEPLSVWNWLRFAAYAITLLFPWLWSFTKDLRQKTRQIVRRGWHLPALQKHGLEKLALERRGVADILAERSVQCQTEQEILASQHKGELLRATVEGQSRDVERSRQEDHGSIAAELQHLRVNMEVLQERLAAVERDRHRCIGEQRQQFTEQVEQGDREHVTVLQEPGCHEEGRRCELEGQLGRKAQRVDDEESAEELEGDNLGLAPTLGSAQAVDLEQERCARLAAERERDAALEELQSWRKWADEQSLRELMVESAWQEELKRVRDDISRQLEEARYEVVRENKELRQRLLDVEGEPDGMASMREEKLELEESLEAQTEELEEAVAVRQQVEAQWSRSQHELSALRCSLEVAQEALAEAKQSAAEELRVLESRTSRAEAHAVVAEEELAEQKLETESQTKLVAKYQAAEREVSFVQHAKQGLHGVLAEFRQLQEREEAYQLEMQQLSQQSAELAGQDNNQQQIRLLSAVKAENQALRTELRKSRQQLAQLEDQVLVTPRRQRGPNTPSTAEKTTPCRGGYRGSCVTTPRQVAQTQPLAGRTPKTPRTSNTAKERGGKVQTPELKNWSPALEPEIEVSPRCSKTVGSRLQMGSVGLVGAAQGGA